MTDSEAPPLVSGTILSTPLGKPLSVRLLNAAYGLKISTIGELAQLTKQELRARKNVGEVAVVEAERFLAGHGLRFADEPSDGREFWLSRIVERLEALEREETP